MHLTNSVALHDHLFFIETLTSDPHDRGRPDTSQMISNRILSSVIRLYDFLWRLIEVHENKRQQLQGRQVTKQGRSLGAFAQIKQFNAIQYNATRCNAMQYNAR